MKLIFLFALVHISVFSNAQRVGIGTTSPNARLEIVGEGSNSSTNALLLKNSINDTLIRVRNDGRINIGYNGTNSGRTINMGGNGLNFFRTDEIFSGAVFPTDTSLIIWSELGDFKYIILQPAWGKVGIGTYRPDAMFDVHGEFKLGETGSILTKIFKASIAENLPSIAAGASLTRSFTVLGVEVNSSVMISPDIALPDGLIIAYARVSSTDFVEVKFVNHSAATINLASTMFHITAIK